MTYEHAIETIQDMLDVMDATGSCYVYKHNGGDIRLKNVLECLRTKQEQNVPLTMDRLKFEGNFCDIAMCMETPGGSFCEDGYCSQRRVWERLKAYEDTGLEPEEILSAVDMAKIA